MKIFFTDLFSNPKNVPFFGGKIGNFKLIADL